MKSKAPVYIYHRNVLLEMMSGFLDKLDACLCSQYSLANQLSEISEKSQLNAWYLHNATDDPKKNLIALYSRIQKIIELGGNDFVAIGIGFSLVLLDVAQEKDAQLLETTPKGSILGKAWENTELYSTVFGARILNMLIQYVENSDSRASVLGNIDQAVLYIPLSLKLSPIKSRKTLEIYQAVRECIDAGQDYDSIEVEFNNIIGKYTDYYKRPSLTGFPEKSL